MLVSHQFPGIGQVTFFVSQPKRNIIRWLEAKSCTLQVSSFQKRKAIIYFFRICYECVKGAVCTFQNQFVDYVIRGGNGFITNANIRLPHTICFIVIGSRAACSHRKNQDMLIFFQNRSKYKLR